MRALASHQCGPGSNPGVDAICGLSLLLVLSFAPRGFSSDTPVFPSPQKPKFSNSNSIRNRVEEEPLCECATSKSLLLSLLLLLLLSYYRARNGGGSVAEFRAPGLQKFGGPMFKSRPLSWPLAGFVQGNLAFKLASLSRDKLQHITWTWEKLERCMHVCMHYLDVDPFFIILRRSYSLTFKPA